MKIKGIVELRSSKVVDLAAFKAERARLRLPLFEADAAPATTITPPAVITAADPSLTSREVEHRSRMLRHLGANRLS